MGTFMTPTRDPALSTSSQSAGTRTSNNDAVCGLPSPSFRHVKLKIPCLPGFIPVNIVGHAGQVIGGCVDRRVPDAPSRKKRASVGIIPASRSGRSIRNVPPSNPIRTSLLLPLTLLFSMSYSVPVFYQAPLISA
ncbi:hypothetical protein ES703_76687 [subsurface metagenome]